MKKIWIILGFIVIAFFMAGCSKKSNDTIQFSTWGTQSELNVLKPIVNEYNKTHATKVEILHIPQNYFQKIHLLFASNLAPDVILTNNLYINTYRNADLFEDLTPYINKEDYFKNAIKTLSYNEKIYAVPRDVSSIVVFYNKDVFEKNKIKLQDISTIEKFYKTAAKLKTLSNYGFCMEHDSIYWENFVSAENKPFFLNEQLTVLEDDSINAFQTLSDKINKEYIAPNKEQLTMTPCMQMFIQQKTPMLISGRWIIPKLDEQANFHWNVAPFPQGKSQYYIPLNATGWAVNKNSKHKQEAIEFINYLSSEATMKKMTDIGLIMPANKKFYQTNKINKSDVFVDVIERSTPNVVPPDYNIIIDKIKLRATSVLGGYKTAKEAFKNF